MDLVRTELLPPILIGDLHREARRQALVAQAIPPARWRTPALAARLGAALIVAGCRMQTAGLRLAATSPFDMPAPCGGASSR